MADNQRIEPPGRSVNDMDLALFAEAVAGAHDTIIITDAVLDPPGPHILYVNRAFEALSGYSAGEITGQSPRVLQGESSCRQTLQELRRQLEAEETFEGSIVNYHRDGSPYHVELRVAPIINQRGETTHYVSQQRDITDQVQSQAERERLLGALEEIPDEVIITDASGLITYVNRAYRERTGLSEEQVRGSLPRVLQADSGVVRDDAGVWEALMAGEAVVHTVRKQDYRGNWLDIEQRFAPVAGVTGGTAQFVITGRDVSDRVAAEEALTRLATTDRLTDLNNRLRFEELLDAELERVHRGGPPFSLALMDIDDFKQINDAHGHEAGDDVLRQLGQLLSHSTRAGDTVGRWGGEEFTLLMPDTLAADARSGALKLSRLVATHSFALPRGITLSCGITEVADNDSIRALMRRADRALYRAKENGKNQVDVELVR